MKTILATRAFAICIALAMLANSAHLASLYAR
jgi:hypothetical protein